MSVEMLTKICVPCGETDLAENFDARGDHIRCKTLIENLRRPLGSKDLQPFLPSSEVFKQKGNLHTGVKRDDAESQPRYKMMEHIPHELVDWTLLNYRRVYVQYLSEAEESLWELLGRAGVTKPEGIRPIRLGSRGGTTKSGPVCAHVFINTPADLSILDCLDRVSEDGKHSIREVRFNGAIVLAIHDLRFVLKMIHDHGLPITHYPGKPRSRTKGRQVKRHANSNDRNDAADGSRCCANIR
jgi:hypothetical protein